MTIIEIPQGRYRNIVGITRDEFVAFASEHDAEFLANNPGCAKWHRPSFREFEAADGKTAPWGYAWYFLDEDGRLKMHSAQYDSSG